MAVPQVSGCPNGQCGTRSCPNGQCGPVSPACSSGSCSASDVVSVGRGNVTAEQEATSADSTPTLHSSPYAPAVSAPATNLSPRPVAPVEGEFVNAPASDGDVAWVAGLLPGGKKPDNNRYLTKSRKLMQFDDSVNLYVDTGLSEFPYRKVYFHQGKAFYWDNGKSQYVELNEGGTNPEQETILKDLETWITENKLDEKSPYKEFLATRFDSKDVVAAPVPKDPNIEKYGEQGAKALSQSRLDTFNDALNIVAKEAAELEKAKKALRESADKASDALKGATTALSKNDPNSADAKAKEAATLIADSIRGADQVETLKNRPKTNVGILGTATAELAIEAAHAFGRHYTEKKSNQENGPSAQNKEPSILAVKLFGGLKASYDDVIKNPKAPLAEFQQELEGFKSNQLSDTAGKFPSDYTGPKTRSEEVTRLSKLLIDAGSEGDATKQKAKLEEALGEVFRQGFAAPGAEFGENYEVRDKLDWEKLVNRRYLTQKEKELASRLYMQSKVDIKNEIVQELGKKLRKQNPELSKLVEDVHASVKTDYENYVHSDVSSGNPFCLSCGDPDKGIPASLVQKFSVHAKAYVDKAAESRESNSTGRAEAAVASVSHSPSTETVRPSQSPQRPAAAPSSPPVQKSPPRDRFSIGYCVTCLTNDDYRASYNKLKNDIKANYPNSEISEYGFGVFSPGNVEIYVNGTPVTRGMENLYRNNWPSRIGEVLNR